MTLTAAQCLRRRDALGGPILAFLLSAAALRPAEAAAGPGLSAAAAETLWPALAASPRALARLSLFSAEPAWLPAFLAADFSALPTRLLLLPAEALLILGHYAGITLHCREAAALLRREEVLAFREVFGPGARDFAVQRAPFFLGDPERLARTLAGARDEARDEAQSAPGARLIDRIDRTARAALAACAGALAPPLAGLFLAKLPGPEAPETGQAELDEAVWYSLQALFKKLLAKETALKPWAAFS